MGCVGNALVNVIKKQFPDCFPGRQITVLEGKILLSIGLFVFAWSIYYLCTHKPTKADKEWAWVRRAPFVFIFRLVVVFLKKIFRMFGRKK